MQNIRSITITKPCHETWQAMAPVIGGRYCQSCCKTVMDFTNMSNEEIISYLSANHHVCGRFYSKQLNSIERYVVQDIKKVSRFRNYRVAALFAAMLTFFKTEAHNELKPALKTEQYTVPLIKDTLTRDSVKFIKIMGTVRDSANGEIIPGVTIKVMGANIGAMTDSRGHFVINVPVDSRFIEFHFIGYETKRVKVKNLKKKHYNVQLTMSATVLGEIVVVND